MIRKYIQDYLTFSKAERRAVIALSVILIVLFALPKFLPADDIAIDRNELASLATAEPGGPAAGKFGAAAAPATAESLFGSSEPAAPVRLRERKNFDPNTLDAAGWISMGVREKTALTIRHYLEKGGRFRTADDLLKIYGLAPALAQELKAYVRIRQDGFPNSNRGKRFGNRDSRTYWPSENRYEKSQTLSSAWKENRQSTFGEESKRGRALSVIRNDGSQSSAAVRYGSMQSLNPKHFNEGLPEFTDRKTGFYSERGYTPRKIRSGTVDIATADTLNLMTLPGIGSRLAARIVSFREKLGGFYTIDQLHEVFGIQDSTFQRIRPHLSISDGHLVRINLNLAAEETLKAHPYIRWQLAKLIVNYRKEHGPFKQLGDLAGIDALGEEGLKKLTPYLEL